MNLITDNVAGIQNSVLDMIIVIFYLEKKENIIDNFIMENILTLSSQLFMAYKM